MAVTSAVATLMSSGLTAITNAITSGEDLRVATWEIGSLYDAAVPPGTVSALPSVDYSGGSSRVLLEQENGLAVFNIVLDESVGDLYVGNIALKVTDPVTDNEVLLAVIMFPKQIYKTKSAAHGGAVGETGNYYLVKLVLHLSTLQSVATVTLSNTTFSIIPSIDDITYLADPSATIHPHQIMLSAPETGAPALIAQRAGDNQWWGFSLSWPVNSHHFGVISGGHQGDWYATDNVDIIFGGYFHMDDTEFEDVIVGGVNWDSSGVNLVRGGSWS